jgi:hypothetical protein
MAFQEWEEVGRRCKAGGAVSVSNRSVSVHACIGRSPPWVLKPSLANYYRSYEDGLRDACFRGTTWCRSVSTVVSTSEVESVASDIFLPSSGVLENG